MDIKEIENLKSKMQEEANKKPDEWFSILENRESCLKSDENGYTLFFKKDVLKFLGFLDDGNKVKDLLRKHKELPLKLLFCGDKLIIKRGSIKNGK
jgi:hypothetical protein